MSDENIIRCDKHGLNMLDCNCASMTQNKESKNVKMTIDELRAEIEFQKDKCIKALNHAGVVYRESNEMVSPTQIYGAVSAFSFILSLIEKGE